MTSETIQTTKQCSKCGGTKALAAFSKKSDAKDGLRLACKDCLKLESRAWYSGNRDRVARNVKVYRAAHPEWAAEKERKWRRANLVKCAARTAKYRSAHPDKVAAYQQSYQARKLALDKRRRRANPSKSRAATAKWAANNPLKGIAYRIANRARIDKQVAKWRADNPEYMAAANHRRRARRVAAEGKHTRAEIAALMIEQNHLCANPYCRVDLRTTKRALDHKVALARGGSNGIENLQWLCKPCNNRKFTLDLDEWLTREAALARIAA